MTETVQGENKLGLTLSSTTLGTKSSMDLKNIFGGGTNRV